MVDGLGRPLLSGLLEGSPELRLQVGERVESYGSEMSAVWFRGSCRQLVPGCSLVDRVVVVVVAVAMGKASWWNMDAANLRTPGILTVDSDDLWKSKKARNKIYSILKLDVLLVDEW